MLGLAGQSKAASGAKPLHRILVAGVGGGGCNAVGHFISCWTDGPEVVAVNTDTKSLNSCGVTRRIQIGSALTRGLSTGGNAAVGKLAAEDDADVFRELLTGVDLLFLVVALGGGTGTGAAPVLARLAREADALIICFATMPFDFEGEPKKRQAEEGLHALKEEADVVICMPNQRLLELAADQTSLVSIFKKADEMVGVSIRATWKLLVQAGLINLSFADVRNLVENSGGVCTFGYGEGFGPDKADMAINAMLSSPIIDRGDVLAKTGALLVNITGGSDLTLMEVQKVMAQLTDALPRGARVFMGAAIDETWQSKLAVTILAAENWQERPAANEGAVAGDTVETERATATSSGSKSRNREVQTNLPFDAPERSRFQGVDPTLYEGEDLDIPTFVRRGIKIAAER